jgi:hypothetical protein
MLPTRLSRTILTILKPPDFRAVFRVTLYNVRYKTLKRVQPCL